MESDGTNPELKGPTEDEVDAAIQAEAEMAAEQAVPEEPLKMNLEDWHKLDTPEWAPCEVQVEPPEGVHRVSPTASRRTIASNKASGTREKIL